MKKIIFLATALSFLALPTIALATTVQPVDSVTINEQKLECVSSGSLNLTITGTATYSSDHRLLVVKSDGVDILNTNTRPATWAGAPVDLAVGEHTITATISSTINQEVKATDTWTFTVEKCVVPVATPSATVATPAATVLPNTGQSGWALFFGAVILFGAGYLLGWVLNKK